MTSNDKLVPPLRVEGDDRRAGREHANSAAHNPYDTFTKDEFLLQNRDEVLQGKLASSWRWYRSIAAELQRRGYLVIDDTARKVSDDERPQTG